jgi:hypothetical protein
MFGLLVTIGSYVLYVFLQSEVLFSVILDFRLQEVGRQKIAGRAFFLLKVCLTDRLNLLLLNN